MSEKIFLIIIQIILMISPNVLNKTITRKLFVNSENNKIFLKVNTDFNLKLLTDRFKEIPFQILVNDIPEPTVNNGFTGNNINTINNITIIWNNLVDDCSSMFIDLNTITYIDLTDFNFSNVNSTKLMFSGCQNLTSIKFPTGTLNLSIEDMSYMFNNCRNLTRLDLSVLKSSNVRNMISIFEGCNSLSTLDISNWDFSKITHPLNILQGLKSINNIIMKNANLYNIPNIQNIFRKIKTLISLDISFLNISSISNLDYMFVNCIKLQTINLSNINTYNIQTMRGMFYNCISLLNIDLSGIITDNVYDMSNMFGYCVNLTSLNLSTFNTSNVLNMISIFEGCDSLTLLDISNWDFSNIIHPLNILQGLKSIKNIIMKNANLYMIENIQNVFSDIESLISLDISFLDISSITNLDDMFANCIKLQTINLSNININNIQSMKKMFYHCESLSSIIDLSGIITDNVYDMSYMFGYCVNLTSLNLSTFNTSNVKGMKYMFDNCNSLKYLDISNFDCSQLTHPISFFNNLEKLQFINLSGINLSHITDISFMFYNLKSLQSLDFPNIDTSSVNNMKYLFGNCNNLKSLNLSNLNTSNTEYMNGMFLNCISLTKLNLSNFITDKVKNITSMFQNCNQLYYLDLSNFNTNNVLYMTYLFDNCNQLKALDLSSFDTKLVENFTNLFFNCKELVSLDLSNFRTNNLKIPTNIEDIFYGCNNLNYLDLSNWDFSYINFDSNTFNNYLTSLKHLKLSKVMFIKNNMYSLFSNLNNIISLNLSNFNTSNVEYMDCLFCNSSKLKTLDLTNFYTQKVKTMSNMFENCISLTSLDLSSFNTSSVTNFSGMFYNMKSLSYIKLDFNINEMNSSVYSFDLTNNFEYCIHDESNMIELYNIIKILENTTRDCSRRCYEDLRTLEIGKNQCIPLKCSNNITYPFLYNGNCYSECPIKTYLYSNITNLCLDLYCDNYYDYEQKNCIDEIPKGYYLNNSEEKTIDKCHPDCEDCDGKPYLNNSNCTSCFTGKFWFFGNCIDINNDSYINFIDNSIMVSNTDNNINFTDDDIKISNTDNIIYFTDNNINFTDNNFIISNTDNNINFTDDDFMVSNTDEDINFSENNFMISNNNINFSDNNFIISNTDNSINFSDNNFIISNTDNNINFIDNNIIISNTNNNNINFTGNSTMTSNIDNTMEISYTNNNMVISNTNNTIMISDIIEEENCYMNCSKYFYIDNIINVCFCTKTLECPKQYNKLIEEKRQCINKCEGDEEYKYEFRNKCYKECPPESLNPNDTTINKYYCKAVCPKERPFEILLTQECVDNCPVKSIIQNICVLNFENNDENENNNEETKVQDMLLDNIESEFTSENYNTSNLDKGEDEVISYGDMTITLTTSSNQKNNINNTNTTIIDLGECETLLRKEYNIPDDEMIYIKKIDVIQQGFKIPKIEYEVYSKFGGSCLKKLNLSICKNSKVSLIIPVKITEDLDKLNTSSAYYNDICYIATSDSGTDISLQDRKNEFVEGNKTVCEDGCDFEEYDYINEKAKCSCKTKVSISSFVDMKINKNQLYQNFIDIKNLINIKIMVCYKVLFNKNGVINNIAFYSILPIIIFHFIAIIIFYINQKKLIENQIKDIAFCINNIELININDIKEKEIFEKNYEKIKIKNKEEKKVNRNITENPKIFKNKVIDNININTIYNNYNKNFNKLKKYKINNPPIIKKKITIKKKVKKYNPFAYFNDDDYSNIRVFSKDIDKETIKKVKEIMEYNDREMNNLEYELALKVDLRTYWQYYLSLIKTKHIVIFTFYNKTDYNSRIIKSDLFFINITIYFVVNALFFNDETMHKIYEDKGEFNLIYQLPQIIYSSIISIVFYTILRLLALSEGDILNFKKLKEKEKLNKTVLDLKCKLNIMFILYFILSFLFLLLFWYYLSMFCAIYRNTQIHLMKDSLISYALSLLSPFAINFIPGFFRLPTLSNPSKAKKNSI